MGDDKKKSGGLFKKIGIVVLVVAAAWGGYFGYAKATGKSDTCLFTAIYHKLVN
jgi:predicted acyltransferase